jgi:hypothetical protein
LAAAVRRNAAAAYRTAYRTKASPQRCADEANRLLKHPEIARRLAAVVARAADPLQVTAERVLRELARAACKSRQAPQEPQDRPKIGRGPRQGRLRQALLAGDGGRQREQVAQEY